MSNSSELTHQRPQEATVVSLGLPEQMFKAASAGPPPELNESVMRDLRSLVRRRGGFLLVTLLLGIALAYLYTKSDTPIYRATATLEIQDLNEHFLNMKEISPLAPLQSHSGGVDLQTQMRILGSDQLLRKVVGKMAPERIPPAAGVFALIEKMRGRTKGKQVTEDGLLENVHRNLQVRETRQSRIVDLSFESPDAKFASALVNRLANAYIEQSVESRLEMSRGTSDWLDNQLQALREKLAASEQELQNYSQRSGLVVTTDSRRPDEDKLRQIQENLTKVQEARQARQSKLETALASPLDAIEAPLGSPLKDHQAKLADLRRQRADLLTVYTPDFDGVRRLDAQISSLEASVKAETNALLQGIRNDYQDAVRRESLLEGSYRDQVSEVGSQAGMAIQYGIYKREADTNRELYNSMLQRAAEAKVAAAMRASNARIVDVARDPTRPVRPSTLMNLGWGATAGLLFGLLLITMREQSDYVRMPGQMAAQLKVPELGNIPNVKALQTIGKRKPAVEVWTRNGPHALESYRAVLTSILFSQEAWRTAQAIVITSAASGDGKTTVVSNLAAAAAQMKMRVLVVDAAGDGGLGRVYGAWHEYGLLDIVEAEGDHSELMPYITQSTPVDNVSLVRTGTNGASALELLYAPRMQSLLEYMRQNYDLILIDAPALMETPDARALGRMADGAVLVVRAGKTGMGAVRQAVARLHEDGTVLLGTVLNRMES
ncbi:MAG: polysaccharide biosynthesis tyrosine autokinase [Acidobacteria bacterium]|nr:polysaccharide biosynthesis tyrosine autokinase [Acidobacteriota bacterium]